MLWPLPTGTVTLSKELIVVKLAHIGQTVNAPDNVLPLINTAMKSFHETVLSSGSKDAPAPNDDPQLKLTVTIKGDDTKLTVNTDESYEIKVINGNIEINATTFYGARHALKTLSQLIIYNPHTKQFKMNRQVHITDAPLYPHRGIMIDTSRNYLTVQTILRVITGLGYQKLNVLHWHLSDASSFPYKSNAIPQLAEYGAYSPGKVYTPEDLKQIRDYGNENGVRILMEVDTPAHMAYGWEWGPSHNLGDLVVCLGSEPWRPDCASPPCGQINPANKNAMDILEKLYKGLTSILEPDMFHMGGDEGAQMLDLVESGYKVIASQYNVWYLDCGVGAWYANISFWCDPYKTWRNIYDHNPRDMVLTEGRKKGYDTDKIEALQELVLGGEAALWGEIIDNNNIEIKLWPRGAALAERLWTNPVTCHEKAHERMLVQRERIVKRGLQAQSLGPEWCLYNQGNQGLMP